MAAAATGSPIRNIALLSITQALGGSSQAILISVAALTAASMAPAPGLATLPVTLMIIGTALSTGPATWLIHTWGRKQGFMFGASVSVPAALLAAIAAWIGNFWLFCVALALFGASAAFSQQYRFAAADSVPPALRSRAISWVLFGGVLAGFIGPQLSALSKDWVAGATFTGTYLIMAILAFLAIGVLSLTRLAPTVKRAEDRKVGRSLAQLLRSPQVIVAMVGAAASYAMMTLVMVGAPLAMVFVCGHTTEEAAFAIQWHIVAMFAPSFVTGSIIARLGAHLTAALGLLLVLGAAIVNLNGISVGHFVASLSLLGVGWNFGFIASTALLTSSYRPEEAARVQGLNEQVVFGVMAVASIASGLLLQLIGWQSINILAIAVVAAAIAILAWGQYRSGKTASA
ncbi:MAG: MFS transporter [Devosia sp.]